MLLTLGYCLLLYFQLVPRLGFAFAMGIGADMVSGLPRDVHSWEGKPEQP